MTTGKLVAFGVLMLAAPSWAEVSQRDVIVDNHFRGPLKKIQLVAPTGEEWLFRGVGLFDRRPALDPCADMAACQETAFLGQGSPAVPPEEEAPPLPPLEPPEPPVEPPGPPSEPPIDPPGPPVEEGGCGHGSGTNCSGGGDDTNPGGHGNEGGKDNPGQGGKP